MSIQEISKITGISADMIRYYEKKGLISPERKSNGYRDFKKSDLTRIIMIKNYSNLGIPLRFMADHLDGENFTELTLKLEEKLEQLKVERHLLDAEITMGKDLLSFCQTTFASHPYNITKATLRYLIPWSEETYQICAEISKAQGIYLYYYRLMREENDVSDDPDMLRTESGIMVYPPSPITLTNCIELPEQTVYRTMIVLQKDEFAGLQDIAPHLDIIQSLGYEFRWEFLIYQIIEYGRQEPLSRFVSVEIPVKQVNSG